MRNAAFNAGADCGNLIVVGRATGQPGMGVGEQAEVTRGSGARSVWRREPKGWELTTKSQLSRIRLIKRMLYPRTSRSSGT